MNEFPCGNYENKFHIWIDVVRTKQQGWHMNTIHKQLNLSEQEIEDRGELGHHNSAPARRLRRSVGSSGDSSPSYPEPGGKETSHLMG